MKLEPKDLYEKLEFDKILALVEKECMGAAGQAIIRQLPVETQLPQIQRKLNETYELKLAFERNDPFPMANYSEITEDLKMLAVEGFVLPVEGLQRMNFILIIMRDIFKFFNITRKENYPHLFEIIRHIPFDDSLLQAIGRVIDENGDIRPDASPELQRIRKAVASKQKELDQVFKSIIAHYRNKGWLTDNVESFRNGRRVLSAPSEHKRKIRGIIHDESTTGRTAFIEPEEVIDINNDIFDLENDEKREIYRILKELSAVLRPYIPQLQIYQSLIVQFDVIQAKARLGLRYRGYVPRLRDQPFIGIKKGFHPLLYMKNKLYGKKTIPFDLVFLQDNRILVLSGPNAGGKSITMKSVGLLQLMLQSGMLVPVDQMSEMGIFQNIFADIGDQQSIEDDLSTYSSRLKNMRVFLENANEQTLVLIDEFGSGTDPKIGGAIAEGILLELNRLRVFGVITTHYSNIKIFAFKTQGIINGSMHFDRMTLQPTYELKVGRPGSSYAFEIAEKTGLNRKVLTHARHRIGANEKAVDELLIELQNDKQELEDKLRQVSDREKQLQKLISNYDELHKDLEYKRKKLKLDSKEMALQQTVKESKEFERVIREIKEAQNIDKAKVLIEKTKKDKEQLHQEVHDLREKIYAHPVESGAASKPIKVGDYVRMRTGGATGAVESLSKTDATVLMGDMRMKIKLRDLQHANEPLDIRKKGGNSDLVESAAKFEPKLDIRGLGPQDAMRIVESFLDQALVTGANSLRIVHGKGTGVLRQLVRNKLREYKEIGHYYHPEQNEGGDGVTIVELS